MARLAPGPLGDWDGTFASHPRESETYVSSGERRMPEELGIKNNLDYLHKFEYHVPYKDIGSENEICATLIGIIENPKELKEVEGEIDEIRWISSKKLLEEIEENPEIFCPWMLIAIVLIEKSREDELEKHANTLSTWINNELREGLLNAISKHLPNNKWRIVDEKNKRN